MLSPKSLIALVVELFPFWEAPLFSLLFPFHHRQLRDVHTETSSIEPDFINILSLPHSTNKEPLAASGQRSKRISWREKGHLCLATLPLDCPLIENKKPFHFFFWARRSIKSRYVTRTTHKTHSCYYIYILYSVCILKMGRKKGYEMKSWTFLDSTSFDKILFSRQQFQSERK